VRLRFTLSALLLLVAIASADKIRVAAAADLNYAFHDVAAPLQKDTGDKAGVIIGSSGNSYFQIQNGRHFDSFFSGDIKCPQKLESAGLAF